jgi:hypothetical protein
MARLLAFGAAAAACLSTTALGQSSIPGGGTGLTNPTYPIEFSRFNPGSAAPTRPTGPTGPGAKHATFSTYWAAGSGVGQEAFFNDDLSCDIDAVTGANGGACIGKEDFVAYAASDAVLTPAQIANWPSLSAGQTVSGNLIQLPSMGVGVAIPVVNATITQNGEATLSDGDLCGIFSGLITDFSQISDSPSLAPGPFEVVYATGGDAGTTFWLTNHLAAVCTNSNSAITFTATSNFASLFPDNAPPSNFVGAKEGSGVACTLAGSSGYLPAAVGYVTPDHTTIDPKSGAKPCSRRPLVVAGIFVGAQAYTPTVGNIAAGLISGMGQQTSPPTTPQAGADPANWVPVIQTVSEGYPIVGYTTFDFAQCYADLSVPESLKQFLTKHYETAPYAEIEHDNGFATLQDVAHNGFLSAILANMLADKNMWQTDIGDPAACKGLAGR